MKYKKMKVVKVTKTDWKSTLRQIERGESLKVVIKADEANALRVAASELNKAGEGLYSVGIIKNTATITNLEE